MTETPETPPAEPEATESAVESPPPPPPPRPLRPPPAPRRRRNLAPLVYTLAFVVLGLALLWIWRNPIPSPGAVQPQELTETEQQLHSVETKLALLEQRPAPAPMNLAPLERRIAALEQRSPEAVNLAPIEAEVASLKTQVTSANASANSARAQAPDFAPLARRVSELEHETASLHDLAGQETALRTQVTALSTLGERQQEFDRQLARIATAQQGLAKQVAELDATVQQSAKGLNDRLQALGDQATKAAAEARKASRLARLQAARAALSAGEPLGTIDGAPTALTRFATAKPPTEADLRLSFPVSAKAALAASRPDTADIPFGQRLWRRAQRLVTVREGDRVIVGDPAAGILARAQTMLDAGDLDGAVIAVSSLSGPAAQAMAAWLDQARALLAAQQALQQMSRQA
ncbi:MAG: mitofilin family membrane protein [Acetobacteraceae bacterium]